MNDDLKENLARLCHEQRSGWMRYLFSEGTFDIDGTWIMPPWAVERWRRHMETLYSDLSQEEKDNDRLEADRFLKEMQEALV